MLCFWALTPDKGPWDVEGRVAGTLYVSGLRDLNFCFFWMWVHKIKEGPTLVL